MLQQMLHANKSTIELSKECGIPVSTTYRRIQELLQAGLIVQSKAFKTMDGKWVELYRTIINSIHATVENGLITVSVSVDNVPDKLLHASAIIKNSKREPTLPI
jgi:predicted transcriptional regulator